MKSIVSPFCFRGGIHPAYNKDLTRGAPIRSIPCPPQLVISLSQHLGAPSVAIVKAGDTVSGGQRLADAAGVISAPIHAPTSGKILRIEPAPTPLGRPVPAIILEPDGRDAWESPLAPMPDWSSRDRRSLAERIGAAGVVGMGGAGFPTQVKLSPPADKPIDTVIINGAECEPYLTGDHRLMLERAAALWQGAAIIRHILGAKTLRIAVEDNKPDAIQALEAALPGDLGDAAVCVLKTSYPQGSEKQQIYSVTGRIVPTGGLPMDVGCVVENVATSLAVWDAVVNGRPLVFRTITISGDAVATPDNLLAPIGTPFAALVAACGGARGRVAKIISGGPMMGFAQASLDVAMNKTSSGLLLLSASRVPGFTSQPCIACGRCIDACPMRLMPAELSQCIEADDIDAAEQNFVMDCFECGSCAFVCPAHRPLVQHMRRAKAVILARRRSAAKK
jgi:electron transport complex protein RnfC